MRCLLDSSAYVAFKRGHPGIQEALRRASEIALSPVVLGELRTALSTDGPQRMEELEQFLCSPRVSVIALDEGTAERYGWIRQSLGCASRLHPHDLWIAASAIKHGLRLLTMETRYAPIQQVLLDWHRP